MPQLLDNPSRVRVQHAETIIGSGLAAAPGGSLRYRLARRQSGDADPATGVDVIVCDCDTGISLGNVARRQGRSATLCVLVTMAQDGEQAGRLAR